MTRAERLWPLALLAAWFGGTTCAGLPSSTQNPERNPAVGESLTVKELRLVDEKGEVVAWLRSESAGTAVLSLGPEKREEPGIVLTTGGGPELRWSSIDMWAPGAGRSPVSSWSAFARGGMPGIALAHGDDQLRLGGAVREPRGAAGKPLSGIELNAEGSFDRWPR